MWRATPELVRAPRQRYEGTDQHISSIAAEFGLSERTLSRMRRTEGWPKRIDRQHGLPKAVQLLEQAEALAATAPTSAHSRAGGNPESAQQRADEQLGPRSLHETRSALLRGDERGEKPPAIGGMTQTSAIERLEALVVQEIAAAETARALITDKRQLAKVSDRNARTLATLTQTLRTLQQMRTGKPLEPEINDDDDMPQDIEEFRRELARRIAAFMESRPDDGDADEGRDAARLEKIS